MYLHALFYLTIIDTQMSIHLNKNFWSLEKPRTNLPLHAHTTWMNYTFIFLYQISVTIIYLRDSSVVVSSHCLEWHLHERMRLVARAIVLGKPDCSRYRPGLLGSNWLLTAKVNRSSVHLQRIYDLRNMNRYNMIEQIFNESVILIKIGTCFPTCKYLFM